METREEADTASRLPDRLGYRFSDSDLLETALTHRSSGKRNNERLEYLGDAILDFIIAEDLYRRFPDAAEGVLTRLRASLVKRETLAVLARNIQLGDCLKLGGGELKSGGWRRDSILANALEAVFGAVYLDSGLDACRRVVLALFDDLLGQLSPVETGKDPKTALQEYLQAQRRPLPVYRIVGEEGLAHSRMFRVECRIEDAGRSVVAAGRSKRIAEQAAARLALEQLQAGEQ